MICNNCGKQLKDGAAFCSGCGATVDAGQQQAPPQQQYQAPPQQQPYQQQYQQAPPPQQPYQQQYQAPPPQQQYQQQYQAPPPQYQQAPPPGTKKPLPKKALFGAAGAAAAVLVFFLAIFPMIGGGGTVSDVGGLDIDVFSEPPGGRGTGFDPTEGGFGTNDQSIAMIEVNQGLSYGFDSETGEFYLMDNFVAGKETGIFVSFTEPPDPKAEILMVVEKEGEVITTLFPENTGDPLLLLFQPKDMSEVNDWEKGVYTFNVMIDDKYAYRETNFFEPMHVKILVVPILANYGGRYISCTGDYKTTANLLFATFPVSRDGFEYILGPELDLTDQRYDLNTEDGQYNVWDAVKRLQTPDKDYELIIGFVPEPMSDGMYSFMGYTFGFPGNIVAENNTGSRKTVPHEIAHCYIIGDEYHGGALNDILNPPPYQMEGWDIVTGKGGAVGTKENVAGGESLGLDECGAIIYDEQRPYWPDQRRLLTGERRTSIMGWSTGASEDSFWITSDIWNHLFKAFTGQLNGNEPGYANPSGGKYYGQCYKCYGDVNDPKFFVQCRSCYDYKLIFSKVMECNCGAMIDIDEYSDSEYFLECPNCWEFLNDEEFRAFNSDADDEETARVTAMGSDLITILEVSGYFDGDGTFISDSWYSYPVKKSSVTANKEGEYSATIYNSKGDIVSKVFFDVENRTKVSQDRGMTQDSKVRIPIDIMITFPDDSAKVVIQKGNKEVYTREVSKNTPKVAFTGLSEGQALSNNTTFTWEGSDADGDSLTYEIWYYLAIDELYLVAAGLTGTSYTADLTSYPGSDQGWFKILASDGVRTGISDSPKVSVPYKAPDILNNIPDGTQFKVTDMIEIQGKVRDAQDGWLVEEGYEWFIDGKPFETYGIFYFFQYPYMLTPGNHTITMKVTNSGGVSSEKDFMIEILEDESDLPADWPKNDITLALRMGFYQPLDRLPSPITRIEFAKMVFGLYASVLPDDLPYDWQIPMPDVECEFSDMSNDESDMDYLYAAMMVAIGLMEPKDMSSEVNGGVTTIYGAFEPNKSLTEREAMQLMFMAIELSKTQTHTTYRVMDESEFIPQLTEWGVFGGASLNAYNAGEKMSKGLTMVRIARFLMYEFDLEDKDYGVISGYFGGDGEMTRGGISSFEYDDDLPSSGKAGGDDLLRKSLPG